MMNSGIKSSSLEKEGPYLASKFHQLYFFLSPDELFSLFEGLQFSMHPLGGVVKEEHLSVSFQDFVLDYHKKVENFFSKGKKDKMPSYLLTNNTDALYKVETKAKNFLLKVKKPVLFIKPHFFTISGGKVHPTLGSEAIYWGFCLSYPQIFQSSDFEKVDSKFSNTSFFIHLRKKLRTLSQNVTFQTEEKDNIITSYRLGRQFFLRKNPDLQNKKITLAGINNGY